MRSLLIGCRRIEELAGKLYLQLAADETYSGKVRQVFQQLGNDEKAHARHIDLVLQGDGKDIDATGLIAWEKISAAVSLAERYFDKAQRERIDEEQALRLAVTMEQEFVKVHIDNAVYFHDKKLAGLFDKLGSEDEDHLKTLKDCLQWWHSERKQR